MNERVLIVIGGATPLVIMVISLLGYISYDMAIAGILFMFSPALFPAIIENYRKKTGWSRVSTVTTTSGEGAIGVIFFVVWLPVSVAITALLTLVWGVLAVQAFIYSKPKPVSDDFAPEIGGYPYNNPREEE